jgi:Fe(3+) dicitrate transport protein
LPQLYCLHPLFFAQEKELASSKDSIKSQNEAAVTLKMFVVTPMQQSPERQPEIKELFFFRVKKMKF